MPIRRAVRATPLDRHRQPARLHPGNPNAQRILARAMQQRAACFRTMPCFRGCAIGATYQNPLLHRPPALATSRSLPRESGCSRPDGCADPPMRTRPRVSAAAGCSMAVPWSTSSSA